MEYYGIILTDFDMKITFPTPIGVRNVTFDRFLKISGKNQKKSKKCRKNSFFQNRQKIIPDRSNNRNLDFLYVFFNDFLTFGFFLRWSAPVDSAGAIYFAIFWLPHAHTNYMGRAAELQTIWG